MIKRAFEFIAIMLIGLWGCGCAFHAGPDGIDAVLAGTFYAHTDAQSEAEEGSSRWTTHAARTWGTSGLEGKITHDSELISITGDGISKNLAGVLGENVIEKIAHQVACALQPAQPSCLPGGDGD